MHNRNVSRQAHKLESPRNRAMPQSKAFARTTSSFRKTTSVQVANRRYSQHQQHRIPSLLCPQVYQGAQPGPSSRALFSTDNQQDRSFQEIPEPARHHKCHIQCTSGLRHRTECLNQHCLLTKHQGKHKGTGMTILSVHIEHKTVNSSKNTAEIPPTTVSRRLNNVRNHYKPMKLIVLAIADTLSISRQVAHKALTPPT